MGGFWYEHLVTTWTITCSILVCMYSGTQNSLVHVTLSWSRTHTMCGWTSVSGIREETVFTVDYKMWGTHPHNVWMDGHATQCAGDDDTLEVWNESSTAVG